MDETNPFAALLEKSDSETRQDSQTEVLEDVFGFTLNEAKKNTRVYLEDLTSTFSDKQLNVQVLEHAVFERLMLSNAEDFCSKKIDPEICEKKVITYLFWCFKRANNLDDVKLKESVLNLILRNAVTSLNQPELYEGQNLIEQLYTLLKELDPMADDFFLTLCKYFIEEEDGLESMKTPLWALLKLVHQDTAKASPTAFPSFVVNIINLFATSETLANIFLDFCQPKSTNGIEYANTLLGALLSISILPKTPNQPYEFFQNPMDIASTSTMEKLLWDSAEKLGQEIYGIILNLLKCNPHIKSRTLAWIGNCLQSNSDRGKLWHNAESEFPHPSNYLTVGDGFMINVFDVMLRLCRPFCLNFEDRKILKVDPTYCAVPNEECEAKGIHLLDLCKETSLLPTSEENSDAERPTASTYSFVTECFYMAHRAFDLGYKVCMEKLVKANHQVERMQRVYQEAMAQGGLSEITDNMRDRMESELSKYFSLKSRLSQPFLLDNLFHFQSSSAFWLNNVAITTDYDATTTCAPLTEKKVTFPLPEEIPETLKCIPEFIIENIVSFLVFVRRFNPKLYEERGFEQMKPLLTFILIYMGSQRTKNPHLRARLAEALEAILPFHKDEPPGLNPLGGYERKRIFVEHEHRKEIIPALLDVFVGIEMTGESVQFEQKFNYRRPMYAVLDYLWKTEEYQRCIIELAEYAEQNMESVKPPIFLRFVNLLINDAIFLLDDSLANMAKLKEMETAREKGDWDKLPINERAQNLGYMQHISMLARFDNILGRDTIQMLVCLTSKITIVFTHSSMVDRVAAMLNYFLLNLVGPNQKNFKVKDQKEYSFDPAGTVLNICKIYVHLKENDAFCLAVSQDGRSYSPQLFKLAEDVLIKIGGGSLISELQEVASNVEEKAAESQMNEELAAEAPEHFLDPIMSSLMIDPVILPSSKQTVDRSTIARHLLSDQSDPFNRAPLTMDQVIRNVELADEIRKWLEERKK